MADMFDKFLYGAARRRDFYTIDSGLSLAGKYNIPIDHSLLTDPVQATLESYANEKNFDSLIYGLSIVRSRSLNVCFDPLVDPFHESFFFAADHFGHFVD